MQTKWIHRKDLCCFAFPSSLLPPGGCTVWCRDLQQQGELARVASPLSCTSSCTNRTRTHTTSAMVICADPPFPLQPLTMHAMSFLRSPLNLCRSFSRWDPERKDNNAICELMLFVVYHIQLYVLSCRRTICKEQPLTFCGSLFFWNKELFKIISPL